MRSFTALVLALTISSSARSEAINFGPDLAASGWSVVTFPGVAPAKFKASAAAEIEVSADGAAGMVWRAMEKPKLPEAKARWSWLVEEGVGPTDPTKRGKDDRTLAVYFVFGDKSDGAKGPMALLSSSTVKALARDRPTAHWREREGVS